MSKLSTISMGIAVILAASAPLSYAAVGSTGLWSDEVIDSEMIRPLTIHQNISVTPAYGEDDEDCVLQTRRLVGMDGKVSIVRKLVCADADID